MEQPDETRFLRRLVRLGIEDPLWGIERHGIDPVDQVSNEPGEAPGRGPTVFTKSRDRLLTIGMARTTPLPHHRSEPRFKAHQRYVDFALF
ncbi:hypothetical protein KO516_08020 [Citreicella sp. C3M06]|uniref:hypothetical protein n=1 Tax=Citreicella sp. C3M06 TaxID=2841564 RepID=UPI001C08A092|nr:hypothetical protein [Citreicella sp. C3M06]MBU2960761.1 hypothetical protein [Citreicella sp. C3M06]